MRQLFLALLITALTLPAHVTAQEAPKKPNPKQLAQALFDPVTLGKVFKKNFGTGKTDHFTCYSDAGAGFAQQLTDQCEKSVAELGRLLEDGEIFSLREKRVFVIGLGDRKDYLGAVQILEDAKVADVITAGLWRKASSFSVGTKNGLFLFANLDPRSRAEDRAGFVAHSITGMYLDLWKKPEKGGRDLPAWLRVGVVLMVDMRLVGHGGYYAIAYGKKQSKDFYRDNNKRDDWISQWKKTKKERAPLDEAFDTPFSRFTHEHRMLSWMACETLHFYSKKSKRGYLPSLIETLKAGATFEDGLKETTKWTRRKFIGRHDEWGRKQKVKSKQ